MAFRCPFGQGIPNEGIIDHFGELVIDRCREGQGNIQVHIHQQALGAFFFEIVDTDPDRYLVIAQKKSAAIDQFGMKKCMHGITSCFERSFLR